jgi:hypothetical protein
MPRITIEISVAESMALDELIVVLNESQTNTHGKLTTKTLLAMLAADAAQVVTRSGSWEAANMREVLQSHGYRG